MTKCDHEHKVCESHLRTALKGVTAKALEVVFDFIVLEVIFQRPAESLGIAIGLEALCYALNYINERGWNRIQWQRKIMDIPYKSKSNRKT
jgi:hypothetical protein